MERHQATMAAETAARVPTLYSLEYGSIAPGDGFIPLEVPQGEAIHTGGLWRSPDLQEVWKPLDAKPYQNASYRVSTDEALVLEAMAGQPGFPRNWRVEVANGRDWLVRPFCLVVGETYPCEAVTDAMALFVEAAVRNLNEQHWEISDNLNVAIDSSTGELFILDLSNAHAKTPVESPTWSADDCGALWRWLSKVGHGWLAGLRREARKALTETEWYWTEDAATYRHVYLQPDVLAHVDGRLTEHAGRLWVITPGRLESKQLEACGLTWGWSPLEYKNVAKLDT